MDKDEIQTRHEKTQKMLEELTKAGIPIIKAEFQSAVNNRKNSAEMLYSENADNPNRRAKMWLTQLGVVFHQPEGYFHTPTANIRYTHPA